MREIEKQIADWRRTMAKTADRRHELLDELEEHLRDEINRLLGAGTSKEDVFQLAVSNLGSPSALAAEFEKLALSRRAKWKPATIAQMLCIATAVLCTVWLVVRIGSGRMGLLLATHVLAVTLGYVTMFIMGGLGICYILACWFQQTGPTQRYVFQRAAFQLATIAGVLTAIGLIVGMIWAKENWGRYWAWDPKEIGALWVIGCAMITSGLIWLKRANYDAIAVVSIVGSICTAWAWFGTQGTVSRDGHIIGTIQASPLLIAFTACHCILLAAVPAMAVLNSRKTA